MFARSPDGALRQATRMARAFAGCPDAVFAWFSGLERDNSKAYFTAARDLYEHASRGGLEAMLAELREDFGGSVRTFRPQRDVRFSPDKSPYKTRAYGILEGAPSAPAGLYAELSAQGLYAGTGYYMPARDQLARLRAAIDDDRAGTTLAAAADAAEDAGLELSGGSLKTAPRGYPRDHPRIELRRRTALIAGRRLPGGNGIARDAALGHVDATWRAAEPLTAWLERHVGPSVIPPERRFGRR